MGSLTWKGGSGDWSQASNWVVLSGADSVPGAVDDVTINASSNYIVSVSGPEAVENLTLDGSGAVVSVTGTLSVSGDLTGENGTVEIPSGGVLKGGTMIGAEFYFVNGGTLQGTTFEVEGGWGLNVNSGILDGTTWQGTISLGSIQVRDGLILQNGTGPGVMFFGNLAFLDSETLNNATIGVNGSGTNSVSASAGTTLTLGQNLLFNGGGDDSNTTFGGIIINKGTYVSNGIDTGGSMLGSSFDNEGTIIDSYFNLETSGDLINNGILINRSPIGSLDIAGNLMGSGTLSLSVEEVDSSSDAMVAPTTVAGTIEGTQHIEGAATGGGFLLSAAAIDPSVVIKNFFSGSTIDLTGVLYSTNLNPIWSGTPTDGTLYLVEGTSIATGAIEAQLQFTGISNSATFSLSPDFGTGTNIASDNAPCFVKGTSICTACGDVAVEDLRLGDMVPALCAGRDLPVQWLGHRHVVIDRHPCKHDILPVCVKAGAFGDGLPRRDLMLSPDHAVFVDRLLIPVRYLLNGRTIVQESVPEVTYYHIELPAHDVIIAEGLPCESYLDTGNRAAFANGGPALMLHPDFARAAWTVNACAELVLHGPLLASVKRRVLSEAVSAGYKITQDANLRVVVDGRVMPAMVRGPTWRVHIPPSARSARLVSRTWVPAHMRPGEDDTRRLGVAISSLRVGGRALSLGDVKLSCGWHDPEPEWRWTGGDGRLTLDGERHLEFDVAISGSYWSKQRTLIMPRAHQVR